MKMNYHLLEYSELKQEAKERRIKLYYVMRKAKLIELLSMKDLPEIYIVEKKRIGELRAEARARGMIGIYMLNRAALLELLYPHLYGKTSTQHKNQNHNNTDKHNPPKSHNSKEVRV
jgi:hypothetical protein